MLQFIKAHPAEALAVALAIFNLMAKVAARLAGTNPEASKALSFLSALGPDVVDALSALMPKKPQPAPDAVPTLKELPK